MCTRKLIIHIIKVYLVYVVYVFDNVIYVHVYIIIKVLECFKSTPSIVY